ncbi:MAG: branched chain amino acid ABC transporter substrate-binding protein, partial [Candidatus Rokuibacteriota bacterium]
PDGLDSSDLVKIAGKAVVGMYYTTAAAPASSPQAKQFAEEYKKKFGKNPEPYAAESYVATDIALRAIDSVVAGGKAPTRDAVTAAIRKVKYSGMTGAIDFDDKGDPKKASYYVMQVSSDDPNKWAENKEAKRLAIAAPPLKK